MKILKGCILRPIISSICLLTILFSVLMSALSTTFSVQVLTAEVARERVVEIATVIPKRSGVNSIRPDGLYEDAAVQFTRIKGVDLRTFAAAYSENLTPSYPSSDGRTLNETWWSQQELLIFVGTCSSIQETPKAGRKSTYNYTIEVNEIIYQNEMMPTATTIKHSETTSKGKAVFEEGKQYLIWGHYKSGANGVSVFNTLFRRSGSSLEQVVNENGRHFLQQAASDSFDFVPFVSELNGSLNEFWLTDMGKLWQERVLAKIEVIEHSVTVIGTDCLESIPAVNSKDCYIIEGETFTVQQYERGEHVCLISDKLAKLNGLKVGDTIPLKVYPSKYMYNYGATYTYNTTYDPIIGFTDEGNWRIVGIYHSNYEINGDYDIHPNTVFLPNQSLTGNYVPSNLNTLPDLYLSYILPEGGWNAFEQEATSLGYAGWFVYGDGGKSEVLEENNRRQTALTEWQAAVETWCKPLPTVSTVLMAVAMLVFVLSKKKEIGRLYAIETTNRTLFLHFFVQTIIVGALAFGLALLLASPILSRVVPTVLRDLADPAYADLLMAGIPEESLSWTPILGKQVLIYTAISAICAAIGAGRRYQFEYHN